MKSKSIKTQADIGCVDLAKGAPAASRSLSELIDVARLVGKPGVFKYKWDISANGTLIIGEIHVPKPEGGGVHQLGHPTLVGGALRIPEARISGMLYADKAGNLIIDNDSGRFSEYEDRSKEQLDEVAALFRENGLPVEVNWVDMQNKTKPRPPIELVNRSDWCGLPDDAKVKFAKLRQQRLARVSPAGPITAMFMHRNAVISGVVKSAGKDSIDSPDWQSSKKVSKATFVVANIRL